MKQRINRLLDELPCTRLNFSGREVPAFKTCGAVGYYVALIVLLGSGLVVGRSLLVLAGLAFVSAISFYAYTYLRRWLTGHESLVLLEHVWFALACNALALAAMREPMLPYLDLVSIALCPFLAFGRLGCTLVGCCHGQPSSVGIPYNEACARDGFPRFLVGVRLFPVPAIEAIGLLAIGATGLVALPFAEAGKVFAWYLLAYSVMRFGLEGWRGDQRPHFLGLSQARWMSLIEFGFALSLNTGPHEVLRIPVCAALLVTLAGVLVYRWRTDQRRHLLAPAHVCEVREQARHAMEHWKSGGGGPPVAHTTSRQLTLAVSAVAPEMPNVPHVSLSLPEGWQDLALLCEFAAHAFPGLSRENAQFTGGRVLHFLVSADLANGELDSAATERLAHRLYGNVLRRMQRQDEPGAFPTHEDNPDERPTASATPHPFPSPGADGNGKALPWYFADVRRPNKH